MTYTRHDAEADLEAALDHGDVEAAFRAAHVIDQMPPAAPPTLIGAALWYAEHGLPVFPLTPLSKKPWRGTHGVLDATCDPDVIRGWWSAGPGFADSNIGLATGHVVDVIDFDGPGAHAAWGREFGEQWTDAEVAVLGTVSTPRPGGVHVYVPSNGSGNRANVVPGVDYRGLGGYVVAPPSILDNRDDQHPGHYMFLRSLQLGEQP